MGFFDSIVAKSGNEFIAKVSENLDEGVEFIDTGSYALNGLLSGSIYGGMPNNKAVALAGEESTGKSFFALSIASYFQKTFEDGGVVYFESEGALDDSKRTQEMLESRGIDTSRFYVVPVITIQEFRTQAAKILDEYLGTPKKDRKPMLFVLDSLGNLSTTKEITDIAEGKETRDMTRSQLIRGAFRVLTLKMNRAKVPMIITNHTYDVVGAYIPTKEMCLVAGTGVKMADGSIQSIENLQPGDLVKTLFGPKEVIKNHSYKNREVFKLTFENGSTVECTGEHKFMIDGEWKSVNDIIMENEDLNILNISVKTDRDSHGL